MMKIITISAFLISLCNGLLAQSDTAEFRTVNSYFSDEVGERLIVRPEARAGSFANSLELRVEDETFFDLETSSFREREIVTIHGGGLSNIGLRFYANNLQSQEDMIQLLEDFQKKARAFRRNQPEINKLDEKWMGQGEKALSRSRVIGEIETDFIARPSVVSLNWDLETGRLWLSLDDFINIDSHIAEPLTELIMRIPEYSRERSQYAEEIASKNEWIDNTLSLPEQSEDEPTADTTDTPAAMGGDSKKEPTPGQNQPSAPESE